MSYLSMIKLGYNFDKVHEEKLIAYSTTVIHVHQYHSIMNYIVRCRKLILLNLNHKLTNITKSIDSNIDNNIRKQFHQ